MSDAVGRAFAPSRSRWWGILIAACVVVVLPLIFRDSYWRTT
jgi:hypothetical protein